MESLRTVAAPPFFFLVGYAQSRTVPLHWIGIGVILTLLESWNADWTWVSPNILLSFVLIRIARPYVDTLLQNHGWVAFIVVVSVLLAVLPIATKIVDYGAEGWLWALFGLCQRRYLDGISAVRASGETRGSPAPTLTATDTAGLMRLLACLLAAVVYVWQEQLIWPSLFWVSASCRSACVSSNAARAGSNPQRRSLACFASSVGAPWKFTLSNLPAPNSLYGWCPISWPHAAPARRNPDRHRDSRP